MTMVMRLTALLVAGAVLVCSAPAVADGMPREKRATVTKKMKKEAAPSKVFVERQVEAPPVVISPPPVPPPPPPPLVWVPGRWTWNSAMSTHVWVSGMYIPAGGS